MSIRRALAAASTAAVVAVPAFSAAPASAQEGEIIRCGPTFVIGPVACKVESTRQEIAEALPRCGVTFVIGPVMCRVEQTLDQIDPGA